MHRPVMTMTVMMMGVMMADHDDGYRVVIRIRLVTATSCVARCSSQSEKQSDTPRQIWMNLTQHD